MKLFRPSIKLDWGIETMFADSRSYPSRTVLGMYQQEQQIAKAEEAGLIVTAADLAESPECKVCSHKGDCEDCEFE